MKQTFLLIVVAMPLILVACSENDQSTMTSEKLSNVIALSAPSVASSIAEAHAESAITAISSIQVNGSTDSNQVYVGVKHDIEDGATPINGYLYQKFWGRWVSQSSGKRYMIGIATLPNDHNPGAIFLEEVTGKQPDGIERIATIRAAALVNKSNKILTVNGGYCYLDEGSQSTRNYDSVIAVLSPKNKEEAAEQIYDGSGIAVVAHQAWFLDVDNEKLIPLSEEEFGQIECRDRKW